VGSSAEKAWARALSSLETGKLDEAERSFKKFLEAQPRHFGGLNLLAVVLIQRGRLEEAERYLRRALSENSKSDSTHFNYGVVLATLNRPAEAAEQFTKALVLNPSAETLHSRGTVFNRQGRYREAIADFDKAISINPKYPDAYCSKGTSLAELELWDQSLSAHRTALSLRPNFAEAWLGVGRALSGLGRSDDALSAFEKALAINPDLSSAWFGRATVFFNLKRYDEALATCDKALALDPNFLRAWVGRGDVLCELHRYEKALVAFDKALELETRFSIAWLGRGNALYGLKDYQEALVAYNKALALESTLTSAWFGRGSAFGELKRFDEAVTSFDKALALNPDLIGAEGARLHYKMHLCDWSNLSADRQHLIASVKKDKANAIPFSLIPISISRDDQLRCAKLWVSKECPASAQPIWAGEIYKHDKIRIGYVSGDFNQHPVSYLIAGMFECHDKTQFEILAISIGPDDGSELRRRLKNSFDDFFEGGSLPDHEIANRIREKEIDILVDLNGLTRNARTGIFALRPAPVQVNYLGYPGTMGATYIDYIIADATLVPKSHQQDYTESIVYLPNSFQVTDRKRAISEKEFSREEVGLPPEGFVFCCFNNSYKFLPTVFDCWMRIVKKVEGSVLWLPEINKIGIHNLKMEAKARGIDPERLVFAKRLPVYADHLARYRAADLFLDTLPYNAHATASDALWAGLPVLTQIGDTFAGRVAASLLTAIGLPELITSTLKAYEDLAIEVATSPEKLVTIKRKLAENRLTTPLFNTESFTRDIERAYAAIYGRYQRGLPPEHTYVA
jgi:protein O-GlcNAc transferase